MTPKTARTKWCPFVRYVGPEEVAAWNRAYGHVGTQAPSTCCIGKDCMAWRWHADDSTRGRDISIKASFKGYASAWMKAHPYNPGRSRKTRAQHERAALDQAQISTCSILRDWIKGQVTAIEVGLLSFEGAFLGQILLPTGLTILEHMQSETRLLAAPEAA